MNPSEHHNPLSMLDYIFKAWPIFFGVLGFVCWLLRVEAKVVSVERENHRLNKELEKTKDNYETSLKEIQKSITEILQHLSKIEGRLEGNNSKNQ